MSETITDINADKILVGTIDTTKIEAGTFEGEFITLTPAQARAEWVKALRSDTDGQAKGQLARTRAEANQHAANMLAVEDGSGQPLYTIQDIATMSNQSLTSGRCCLGVACEVAVRHGVIKSYDESAATPERVVLDFFGLRDDAGRIEGGESVGKLAEFGDAPENYGSMSLINLNDGAGWTFDQIADVIEAGLVETTDNNDEEN